MKPFLITGCGRSGTAYTAKLLTMCGIRTSHEEFFTPFTPYGDVSDFPQWLVRTHTEGEVSSVAAPVLDALQSSVTIIHQVRNPVSVIRSLMGERQLHDESLFLPGAKMAFRYLPELKCDDPPIVRCMKYWIGWNGLVESQASRRFRVEFALEDWLSGILFWPSVENINIRLTGSRYHGGRRDKTVSWQSLPGGFLKEQIEATAARYGYTLEDLEGSTS